MARFAFLALAMASELGARATEPNAAAGLAEAQAQQSQELRGAAGAPAATNSSLANFSSAAANSGHANSSAAMNSSHAERAAQMLAVAGEGTAKVILPGTTAEDAQLAAEAPNRTHEAVGPTMELEEVLGVNLSASAANNVWAQAMDAAAGQSRLRGASARCADRLGQCSRWASKGYCAPKWVSQGRPVGTYWCPAACGKCGGKGDWDFCSSNSECRNGCCSREYSDDGRLKCTPGGSQCRGGGGGSPGGDQMRALLDRHNFYRRKHHAPALSWDSGLAAQAQGWADRCVWRHSHMPGNGENLFAYTGSFSGAAATDSWYNEIRYYDFNHPGFSMRTGHFTQLVWRATQRIGCAVKFCSQLQGFRAHAQFLVCEYRSQGNVIGHFRANVLP